MHAVGCGRMYSKRDQVCVAKTTIIKRGCDPVAAHLNIEWSLLSGRVLGISRIALSTTISKMKEELFRIANVPAHRQAFIKVVVDNHAGKLQPKHDDMQLACVAQPANFAPDGTTPELPGFGCDLTACRKIWLDRLKRSAPCLDGASASDKRVRRL